MNDDEITAEVAVLKEKIDHIDQQVGAMTKILTGDGTSAGLLVRVDRIEQCLMSLKAFYRWLLGIVASILALLAAMCIKYMATSAM